MTFNEAMGKAVPFNEAYMRRKIPKPGNKPAHRNATALERAAFTAHSTYKTFSGVIDITKVDPDKQQLFGWASVVEQDGHLIVDKQGDIILPSDLEAAAYDFMLHVQGASPNDSLKKRGMGDMHTRMDVGRPIESMVFTKEKQDALGIDLGKVGWWVGFKVDDPDVWAAHKRGERPEFSIGGTGTRTIRTVSATSSHSPPQMRTR